MRPLTPLLIPAVALVVVFLQASFNLPRAWLGAQIDFLPGLMVFASLSAGLTTIASLAVVGGLSFDSLSANPLGVSVLPLFAIGSVIYRFRHLILREQGYARWLLGLGASLAMPLLTLLVLLSQDVTPLLGLGSWWQWLIMGLGGSLGTLVWFWLFDRLEQALSYQPIVDPKYRPDREIRRSRI